MSENALPDEEIVRGMSLEQISELLTVQSRIVSAAQMRAEQASIELQDAAREMQRRAMFLMMKQRELLIAESTIQKAWEAQPTDEQQSIEREFNMLDRLAEEGER